MSTYETVDPDTKFALSPEELGGPRRHRKNAHTKTPRPKAGSARATGARRYMVLASGPDDVAAVDMRSGALARLRVAGFGRDSSELKPFDLVEASISFDPERDDLAHPEAVSITGFPEVVGSAPKRQARRRLRALVAPNERHLLGFAGSAAPYWEFRGMRPSLALVAPAMGPLLFRRQADDTTWARFGWSRSDNWLPVEDNRAISCLWAAGRDKLTGKDLATAIGFRPRYLLVALTPPRSGHCYKTIVAMLPRP
ncbi:MAG: hypothetical protein ACLP6E_19520 [Acidimicrobiales bacterium]